MANAAPIIPRSGIKKKFIIMFEIVPMLSAIKAFFCLLFAITRLEVTTPKLTKTPPPHSSSSLHQLG